MSHTPERPVLIVEHDVWIRWTLRALFEEAGFEVVCASNGVSGLRRAVELRPRLIVLGGPLPEIATDDLTRELTAVHQFSRTQVLTAEEVFDGNLPDEPQTRSSSMRPGSRPGRRSASAVRRDSSQRADRPAAPPPMQVAAGF
jgi:CheY-like chemotaxis protein